jgi:hypothetical protein
MTAGVKTATPSAEETMKLYMHPVSTTSRPVMQFITDNDIPADMQVVDILKGEHFEPAYSKIIPTTSSPCSRTATSASPRAAIPLSRGAGSPPIPGPQAAPGQRGAGLVQFNFYRLGLRPDLRLFRTSSADAKVQGGRRAWEAEAGSTVTSLDQGGIMR